jgi:Domain of unknown function (DUF5916)/Carbohydrate family 9 binding domain-like
MNRIYLIIIILFFSVNIVYSQQETPIAYATKTDADITIDGNPEETVWDEINAITDFTQYDPFHGKNPRFNTEIKILYDDNAIYFSGKLFDTSSDSILKQLGNRDDELNADCFTIEFDTYNSHQDAFTFYIYASGVQGDLKTSDYTYDAVWQSNTKIHDWGWSFELKIPFSALRFPAQEEQIWGLQLERSVRRYREFYQWSLTDNDISNPLNQWGELHGIKDIKSGVRLSFAPYLNCGIEHFPYSETKSENYSYIYGGGMDLKYGISESFTLDMTLLPDFSQVQSDDKVKNLSAFETTYSEQREFFKEAVDLFNKGNLFYSRRIGRTPIEYYNIEDNLGEGEYIINNPGAAQLINATKISGRTKKGTGIGFLNAYTNSTYATISDSIGNERRILSEPNTNYNIFVIDQTLKNNSSFYIINTNVSRGKDYGHANVTGSGITLSEKSTTYYFSTSGAVSQKMDNYFTDKDSIDSGYKYAFSFSKQNGNFRFSVNHNVKNKNFDINDFGITKRNNYENNNIELNYFFFDPFWKLKEMYNTININYNRNLETKECINNSISYNTRITTMKYLTLWYNNSYNPSSYYDYYEPRQSGSFYERPSQFYQMIGASSDYRKAFALDIFLDYAATIKQNSRYIAFRIRPVIRFNDHLNINYTFNVSKNYNQRGYTTIDTLSNSIFASRNVSTCQNVINATYVFVNNLSLKLRVRHYWAKGINNQFYTLDDEGQLIDNPSFDASSNDNYNFNFNAFNIDLGLYWEFAPGSNLSIVWKNEILTDESEIIHNFFDNIDNTFKSPQRNILTLKVFYYLDYMYLRKSFRKDKT